MAARRSNVLVYSIAPLALALILILTLDRFGASPAMTTGRQHGPALSPHFKSGLETFR